MIVKIDKREDPYARIDNRVISDERLSYRARGVLAYLLSKPKNWTVRTEEVIAKGLEGREAIRAVFRELATLGYAKLVNTAGGREWHIYETPIAQKPVDGPPPRKPTVQKPVLLVTKEKSTNERVLAQAETIYQAYPRKVGKPAAVKAIVKALRRINAKAPEGADRLAGPEAYLLERTQQFAQCWNGDLQFCPNPSTWFNQERFNDDPSTWGRRGADKGADRSRSLNAKNSNADRAGDY